ncbi:hypothetical protein C8F01DRAFT_206309 [Mycena amicta]|nr:hypothetical protein C8F01DRAFT_206309 [Mycena amicta]
MLGRTATRRRSVLESGPCVSMRTTSLTPATTTALRRDIHSLRRPSSSSPTTNPTYTDPMLGCSCFRRLRSQRLFHLSTIPIDLAVLAHTMRLCSPRKRRPSTAFARRTSWDMAVPRTRIRAHLEHQLRPFEYGENCQWRESESDGYYLAASFLDVHSHSI